MVTFFVYSNYYTYICIMKIINQYKSQSGQTLFNHIIMNDGDVCIKSYDALILLNDYLRELDVDYMKSKWELQEYLNRRHLYLKKIKKQTGDLVCHYCGKNHLEIGHRDANLAYLNNKNKMLATIDHVIPVSSGINVLDENNWVVACKKCNSRKGSMNYDDFINKNKK